VKYLLIFTLIFAFASLLSPADCAAEELIHVVGRGETIYSISRLYQVAADELMRANNITDPSRLSLGRRLVIPASVDTAPQRLVDYRVVRGDTLFSLARAHGISLQNLLDINGFSSNHSLRAGDVIKVPGQNAVASNPPDNTSTARVSSGLYSLRWPVTPKDISYMTGQMGVVVEGDQFESVRSVIQGNVVSAGPWRKFGRVVIVETTGGYYYMYGGLETVTVSIGDRITTGMELGKLGINSVSEKAQLFFMVFRNDIPIDPATAPRAGTANSGNNSRT